MTDEALWALGRGTGITALVFLTLSMSLGIATRSGRPMLSLPRFAVADVHRFAALAGTVLVVIHVATLLADPYAQLRLVDSVVPFLGIYRPLWQGLGTLAFDVLAAIVVTSLLRHRIGVRAFRARALGGLCTLADRLRPCPWQRDRRHPLVVPAGRRRLRGRRSPPRWDGGCAPTTPSTATFESRCGDDTVATCRPEPISTASAVRRRGSDLDRARTTLRPTSRNRRTQHVGHTRSIRLD